MKVDLTNKTAVVTGSTAGIGLAIAKGLAQAGSKVVINGRKQETVDKGVAAVHASVKAAAVSGVAADVSTAEGCAALIKAVPSADILINNAGIFEPMPFFEITDADWTRYFETNVMSGIRLSRAYMPDMLERNWGRVIFISSESGVNIPVEMIQYGLTKTAQLSLTQGLAQLTAGTNVTVNSVLPGPTRSEGVEEFLNAMARAEGKTTEEMAESFVAAHRPASLLRRFATVEEVANMVVYAASNEASATNGAALRVEGGILRTIG
ncbi:SDR family oxidoreductase [Hyphomicrobium sp.]|uniref:SDR family NAD(P)-dependent oxidoreductase n=1 Tax=Hyphomicrobium sp. TaxID=82 RepID=UPI002D772CC5|nr:SDR family oxidoreductase [Hyphomicrobium sp.]HET6390633.1 SDR family oxidoreductase [Hyphomicrobium sp.]